VATPRATRTAFRGVALLGTPSSGEARPHALTLLGVPSSATRSDFDCLSPAEVISATVATGPCFLRSAGRLTSAGRLGRLPSLTDLCLGVSLSAGARYCRQPVVKYEVGPIVFLRLILHYPNTRDVRVRFISLRRRIGGSDVGLANWCTWTLSISSVGKPADRSGVPRRWVGTLYAVGLLAYGVSPRTANVGYSRSSRSPTATPCTSGS